MTFYPCLHLNKRMILKEAVLDPTASSLPSEEKRSARLFQDGCSKKQEEKSQQMYQERVQRYHQVHELQSKKADVADIALAWDGAPHGLSLLEDESAARARCIFSTGKCC